MEDVIFLYDEQSCRDATYGISHWDALVQFRGATDESSVVDLLRSLATLRINDG